MACLLCQLFRRRARSAACLPPAPAVDDRPAWSLPKAFLERELKQAGRYRKAVSLPEARDARSIAGLAISGGGIRSAVYSLGVLQGMAEKDALKQFGYLSTVSGGSYIGAFYGSLFVPDELRAGNVKVTDDHFEDAARRASCTLGVNTPPVSLDAITPIAFLRDNCNYLTPNGVSDVLQSIVFAMRNWFAVQYVIGVALLTILLWITLVFTLPVVSMLNHFDWSKPLIATNWMVVPLLPAAISVAIAAFVLSPLSRAYWLTQNFAQETGWLLKGLPIITFICLSALALAALFAPFDKGFGWLTLQERYKSCPGLVVSSLLVVVTGLLGILYLVLAWIYVGKNQSSGKSWFPGSVSDSESASNSRAYMDGVRNALTNAYTTPLHYGPRRVLDGPLQLAFWFAAVAAVNVLGTWTYRELPHLFGHADLSGTASLSGSFGFLASAAAASWAAAKFLFSHGDALATGVKKIPQIVLASVVAVMAAVATLVFWSFVAHAVVMYINVLPADESPCMTLNNPPLMCLTSLPQAYHSATEACRTPLSTCMVGGAPCAVSAGCNSGLDRQAGSRIALGVICGLLLLLAIIDGLCIQFLNLSTYQRLYSTRLTRAFLGATNRLRLINPRRRDVTSLVAGDSITMGEYFHPQSCAPVHLINTTINKTIDWDSSLVQRGARGMALAIGPAGATIGARLGVLDCDWAHANDVSTPATYIGNNVNTRDIWLESLTLGDWIAISGAAVSTGLGQITRAQYSLLLGIANIRLGYWWDTYSAPFPRGAENYERARVPIPDEHYPRHFFKERLFGTQFCLRNELLGEFDGPRGRRWYLSDGGHFENTGGYELLRRQLEFIVIIDNGCDPKLQFEDVANLIRHARVDFSMEILEKEDERIVLPRHIALKPGLIAKSFDEFKRRPELLAVRLITQFSSDRHGQLIIVKPRVTADAPYDVRQYGIQHTDFPNESTANQFFDDVQWESHRKLGYSQALALLG